LNDVSEVYCGMCYQNKVVKAMDASVTFEELLQSKAHGRAQTRGISIAGEVESEVGKRTGSHCE
jgi:hypothetical protein